MSNADLPVGLTDAAPRTPAPERRFAQWAGDLKGGLAAAVAALAMVLTWGVLVYGALGPELAAAGVRAAFITAIFASVVAALAGGTTITINLPRASTVLVFTTYVATLAADPRLARPDGPDATAIIMLASACVLLAGLLQVGLGALRLGGLVRFVPHPVLAGFILGVAVLIVVAQVPHLLGIAGGPPGRGMREALAAAQPGTLAIGVATAAVTVFARRWPALPAALLAVVACSAAYHLLHWLAPALPLGPLLGTVSGTLVPSVEIAAAVSGPGVALLAAHWVGLVNTALILAVIGSLDALLGAAATDNVAGTRHAPNRELIGQGLGNVTSGVLGGIPLCYSPANAMGAYRAGARTRLAALYCSIGLAALLVFGRPVLALIPIAVLSGVMLTLAFGLVDRWAGSLARRALRGPADRDTRLALGLVAVVCGATLAFNFVVAVAVGVILSMILFITAMNRSLVRATQTGAERWSRRLYPDAVRQRLREQGRRIRVLELEGPLFFGTAERLSSETGRAAADARVVILDLRRVESIDASGALALEQLSQRLARRGVSLYLAHVTPDGRRGRALTDYRTFIERPRPDWFEDVDRALESAERLLLAESGAPAAASELPLAQSILCAGLDAREIDSVARHMERHALAAGDALFREGDPGDRLYVLARGVVTISASAPHGTYRIVTAEPGAMFGELAMLDGAPRSAAALADEDCVLFSLSTAGLARLQAADPQLAARLLVNVFRHLAHRLRVSTDVVREAADSGDR